MKEAIFKDPALQTQFEEDGFVKLTLFDSETLSKLQSLYSTYFPEDVKAFYSSSYTNELEPKQTMSKDIVEVVNNAFEHYFTNFRLLGAAFLIKGKDTHSEMPMHQDWTIVDEKKYYAVNVWMPLIDTTEENGTLELMKGSHNWNHALRAPTLPMSFVGLEENIKPSLSIVNAKAGEVVVLNQATIHYSKPNLSNEMRPAITAGMVSGKAPLKFYYWDKERAQVEEFEQEDDFLLRIENFMEAIYQRPSIGKSVAFHDYDIPKMSLKELNGYLGKPMDETERSPSFFQRIFGRS